MRTEPQIPSYLKIMSVYPAPCGGFLQAAQQGFTSAAAKYSTARGVLSFLGPAMWVWLGTDLALKAIGPDYARVVKAVSFLAQIRLLHTHGFTNPVRPA